MRFSTPLALLLLLALPLIAWMGWPSHGYGRKREIASLILRMIIALCLIFALAGLEIVRKADNLAVVFLIDASDSMPAAAKSAAVDYVRQALEDMGPDDQAAIILFGGDALVERPMSNSKEVGTLTSIPNTTQTDLAEAIRLSLALYPPGTARRLIILSDGAETSGDALAAARLAAASGVEITISPFVYASGTEVLVTDVEAPSKLLQNEQFDLRVTVEATEPIRAGVRVLAAGQVVYEGTQELSQGTQSFSLPLTAGEPGFIHYNVQISPEGDGYYQNNELAAYSQVAGPPKVLLVAPPAGEALPYAGEIRPDEYTHLLTALEAAGFTVEAVRPSGLPSELALLSEYASVVMVDVPARDLSNRQMSAIQSYVRDLGGGLVAVGGPTSYGVGGYFRTPLEETLPVDMQIKDQQRRPALAIVFIIDHSGSMSGFGGEASKLDLAKEAASRSVELMFPTDRVGVITFDDSASWVVEMTDLSDPGGVIAAIGGIGSGGGTDILAGLQAMANVLPNDPAAVKHVILLTDGGANPQGIPELVQRMYEEYGITLSTVGIGNDAATQMLADLANVGGGRYHFAEAAENIPSIFTEETTLASRSYIIEETFYPQGASPSPILAGITEVPPLHGYVGTSAKDTAQTILVSAEGDPVLAAWQYGLGKAVAFTSDASPRWARDWVTWPGYAAFWAQVVRYTLNENIQTALDVQVIHDGETATLVVDAQNEAGLYLNNYAVTANVIAPDGQVVTLELPQVAPGRYEAEFVPAAEGAYLLRVDGSSQENGESLSQIAGWVLSYSPEYRDLQADPDALYRIVAATGGKVTGGDPAEAFAHTLPVPDAARPVWPWLLTLAALLLPWDIAVRRLAISKRDVSQAFARVFGRLRLATSPAAPAPLPQRSQRMSSLMRAKERAGEGEDEKAGAGERASGRKGERGSGQHPFDKLRAGSERRPTAGRMQSKDAAQPDAARPAAHVARKETSPPPARPKPPKRKPPKKTSSSSTASALLRKKRERRDKEE